MDKDAYLEAIRNQTVFTVIEIEDSGDHMGVFDTFWDCFKAKINDINSSEPLILRITSFNQGRVVVDVFYYFSSNTKEILRYQFLQKYPRQMEN